MRTTAALAGASFAALALAGCANGATASGPADDGSAPSSASSGDGAGAASGGFKDGTYTARGEYNSPGGLSAIDVTVTLKDDTVTAVKVVPKAENATAVRYEEQFASGIGPKVIGKKLTELNVTKVSGSSLTGEGFERAVEEIEKQAA